MQVEWKKGFLERYKELTDLEPFLEYSLKQLPKTIRVNTLKATIEEMKKRLKLSQIPWCKEGFTTEGYALGNTMEHFLGYFYIQSAASMIPPEVLDPKESELILDMCASPGSKTSQIAAKMKNTGLIIANDVEYKRMKPLTMNLQRCGVSNTIFTMMHGRFFKDLEFDKILVDAPCTGIGIIRKSLNTIQTWNPNMTKMMSGIQKQLIATAFGCLKEGGTLVYSTCSLEPEEDEEVINSLLEEYDNAKVEKIDIEIKRSKAINSFEKKEYNSEVKNCLRIWPQDNDTEGFFATKIRKG